MTKNDGNIYIYILKYRCRIYVVSTFLSTFLLVPHDTELIQHIIVHHVCMFLEHDICQYWLYLWQHHNNDEKSIVNR